VASHAAKRRSAEAAEGLAHLPRSGRPDGELNAEDALKVSQPISPAAPPSRAIRHRPSRPT
jgi:hypothetical protein